jgi:hypothetical protein
MSLICSCFFVVVQIVVLWFCNGADLHRIGMSTWMPPPILMWIGMLDVGSKGFGGNEFEVAKLFISLSLLLSGVG